MFRLGCEIYWDTTSSASPFELSHWCQDLQALAAGQRRPPALTRLGEPREFDTLKTPVSRSYTLSLRKSTHPTNPTGRGQMLSCLSEGSIRALDGFEKVYIHSQAQTFDLFFNFQMR